MGKVIMSGVVPQLVAPNTVKLPEVGTALNDLTWEEIRAISDAGVAASYFAVGDKKVLNNTTGNIGDCSFSNGYCTDGLVVYILGFDHNSAYEGTNKIHFGGFKYDLNPTGEDWGCAIRLVSSQTSSYTNGTKYPNMNHWGAYNYGGWRACDLRYDILGSTDVPPQNYGSARSAGAMGYDPTDTCATNPVANTLLSHFPEDLRAVMKPVTKYSDGVGNSSNSAANVVATVDYLPLLSEFEVYGERTYANTYEKNYQEQYDYYKAGNEVTKYAHGDITSSAMLWWLRSAGYSNATYFCIVGSSTSTSNSASKTLSLAPMFCV